MEIIDLPNKGLGNGEDFFNSSIIKFKNKLLMAYRVVQKHDSWINLIKLDKNLKLKGKSLTLDIPHRISKGAHKIEDPRLFTWLDTLYCQFGNHYKPNPCSNIGLALLSDKYEVSNVIYPNYGGNTNKAIVTPHTFKHPKGYFQSIIPGSTVEKNWGFFEYKSKLYCIYRLNPLEIMECNFEGDCHLVHKSEYTITFPDFISGGTPPVKVGEKYCGFYHSFTFVKDVRTYYLGYYEIMPNPWKVKTLTKGILYGDKFTKGCPHKVVFPCGAILEDNIWTVSYGYNDKFCKFLKISVEELDKYTISI